MHTQKGVKKDSVLNKFEMGAHPIIEHFIKKMRIRDIISSYVPRDKRLRLDDGDVLALLIHNILTTPHPLYEMEDWLRPLDAEALGLMPQETCHIQDDRIGKSLARFYEARHKDVFFRLALRAIKVFELDCSRIHHDTTTVTFAGKYPGVVCPGTLDPWPQQGPPPRLETTGLGAIRHGRRRRADLPPDLRREPDR